jgi:signal peptidase I
VAILLATLIRSFFFEPFHIPSSSMNPTLVVGDYIFVKKYSYGYSRYSFPFGINFFQGRILSKQPQRGDVLVFRLPSNPQINYIKRVIGLPGDRIQMRGGRLFINGEGVKKTFDGMFSDEDLVLSNKKPGVIRKFFDKLFQISQREIKDESLANDGEKEIKRFSEELPEGKILNIFDQLITPQDNTEVYKVPQGHYFMMGDNRDNSQDSRFLDKVGYVPEENLVGKADVIFFSARKAIWQFWNLQDSMRFNRLFKKIY